MIICKHGKCTINASFGKKGTKKIEYCKEHAPKNYIDVKSKKCLFKDGCDKHSIYGKKKQN